MVTLREWIVRLSGTVHPRRSHADLEDELRQHVNLAIDQELERGLPPAEARRVALARTGGAAHALEALRDQHQLPGLRDAVGDVRHAFRVFRKAPGFAVTSVVTLALGLGATATVFCALDALFIRPLAVTDPHQLVVVLRAGEFRTRFPLDFHRALMESSDRALAPIATATFPVTMVAGGAGSRISAAFITPNYFEVLGVRPALGRLRADEGDNVVVISHRLWQQAFGGRSAIVGEVVRIGGSAFVIGGVAAPGFRGLQLDIALDLWMPMSASSTAVPIPSFRPPVDIVARLIDLSLPAATSRLNAAYDKWWSISNEPRGPRQQETLAMGSASHGLESAVRNQFRASLGVLVGICVCLWLVTIVNVAGLLTARFAERAREMALRRALGATSYRLCLQLLAEVAVLVATGLLAGYLCAAVLSSGISRWLPAWAGIDIRISPLVLVATAATAILSTLVIALVQAVSIRRDSVPGQLAPGSVRIAGGRSLRLSTCLVGVQLAVTVPLVVVAALLAQSLYYLGRSDTGFERSNLLQIAVEPALVGHAPARASAYYRALTEQLRAVPGVADASVSSGGALSGYGGFARLRHDNGHVDVAANDVDDRYFGTMGVRVVAGRPFNPTEAREGPAIVIVNDVLAQRLFGSSERAVGQVVTFERGAVGEARRVIGVVANTADVNLRDRATPTAYLPVGESGLLMVHVRSLADPAALAATVRRAAMLVDAGVPVLSVQTIESRRRHVLQRERLLAVTSAAIGWAALVLSAVGLFGRINREVVARMPEMVIRSALGATPFQVVRLVFEETARLLVVSGAMGTGASVVAAHILQGHLYGVSSLDFASYLGAAVLLIVVAGVATTWPLRRAWKAGASTQLLRA